MIAVGRPTRVLLTTTRQCVHLLLLLLLPTTADTITTILHYAWWGGAGVYCLFARRLHRPLTGLGAAAYFRFYGTARGPRKQWPRSAVYGFQRNARARHDSTNIIITIILSARDPIGPGGRYSGGVKRRLDEM